MARKANSRRNSSRKVNNRRNTTKRRSRMAKRRFSRKSIKSGFGRVGSSLRSGMLGEAIKGAGAARLSHVVTDRVAPQYSSIVAVGSGFAAGGIIGGVTAALTEGIIGGLGGEMVGGSDSV